MPGLRRACADERPSPLRHCRGGSPGLCSSAHARRVLTVGCRQILVKRTGRAQTGLADPSLATRRRSHTELVEEIARNLRPAAHIQRLADKIEARLMATGPYNGLHLRAEADAHFWDHYTGSQVQVKGCALAEWDNTAAPG